MGALHERGRHSKLKDCWERTDFMRQCYCLDIVDYLTEERHDRQHGSVYSGCYANFAVGFNFESVCCVSVTSLCGMGSRHAITVGTVITVIVLTYCSSKCYPYSGHCTCSRNISPIRLASG